MRTDKWISTVVGYKINIQKSVAFLYANNKVIEMEVKKTIPFTTASEKNKMPSNKPNQGGKRPIFGKLYNTEERNWRRYK